MILKETLMTKLFKDFNLSEEMLSAISDMGFVTPSPIQAETLVPIMEGRDIIGQAHTGTGKTAAYAIPAIEKLDRVEQFTQLLILCPTRELVIQVEREIFKLTKYSREISFAAVYGGQAIEKQLSKLERGAQIVIGTPGRLMDHLRRGSVDISMLKTVVLDEADEMLDMGFREDIAQILEQTPKTRQTVMFSATMEDEILKLTKKFQNDPVIVNVITESEVKPEIEQEYFEVASKNKQELLSRLLDYNDVKLGLIFCNTKNMVDELVENLKERGHYADGLHGDLNQNQREKVMKKFRSGSTSLLVATDVAGRGIDVSDVEAVFNYDLPRDDEDYIHRIGRTGRAGKKGKAFTFVSSKQVQNIRRIERANGQLINKGCIPEIESIEEKRISKNIESIKSILGENVDALYFDTVKSICGENGHSPVEIAAALLKLLVEKETENHDMTVDFSETEFVQEKRKKSKNKDRFRKERQNRSGDYSGKKSYSNADHKIIKMMSKKRGNSRKTSA